MRLVLDQGVPRDAAVGLRSLGHDCVHVGDAGMWSSADDEILLWAGQDAVVVTLDADFDADLRSGSLVTVKPYKTTCHRLPIGGAG